MFRLSRIIIASLVLTSVYTSACELNAEDGYRDLICEPDSCFTCAEGVCATYYCAEDQQCPMDRFCTADNLCAEVVESEASSTEPQGCKGPADCGEGGVCVDEERCTPSLGASGSTPASTPTSEPGVSASAEPVDDSGATEGSGPGGESGGTSELTNPTDESAQSLPAHPEDLCIVNDDCGFAGVCLDGGCYFACDALGACPPDQRCDAGQCLPTDNPEVICTFNGECGPDRVCIEGQCFSTCAESLDCGEQLLCTSGLCTADTAPVIQCSGSGACADDQGCFDGKCLALCDVDRPCGQEGICQFGYCHQKVTCTLSDQCSSTQACLDGTCQ
jgi:hypothetical protein